MSEAAVNACQYSPQDPTSFMIKCHVWNKLCNKFSVWLETGLKKIQDLKLLLTSKLGEAISSTKETKSLNDV